MIFVAARCGVLGGTVSNTMLSHCEWDEDRANSTTLISIIAIRGLVGHGFGSWKSCAGYTMWLRDFLPEYVPYARILAYDYDSALLENPSNASIREYSQNFFAALRVVRARKTVGWCLPVMR